MDVFLQSSSSEPLARFAGYLAGIQSSYFNKKQKHSDEKFVQFLVYDEQIGASAEKSAVYQKHVNENQKAFLRPLFSGEFGQHQSRDKLIALINDQDTYYFKLLMLVGAAAISGDTFLSAFYEDASLIKTSFVPFVQDFNIELGSQS